MISKVVNGRRAAATDPGARAPRISRVPGIHGGEPIIDGTRVPVRTIVLSLQDYDGDRQRLADDLGVDLATVEAALAYYAAHRDEIERIIDRHERAAYAV